MDTETCNISLIFDLGFDSEELVILIAPIHGHDRTRGKEDLSSNTDIMLFAVGDISIGWEVAIVIKEKVKLDCSFGAPKFCPREKR